MIKKFEIPYNFDPEIIDFIIENNYQDYVDVIYMAPFKEDYLGAKAYVYDQFAPNIRLQSDTREDYEKHVKKIIDNGLPLCILFQNQEQLLTDEMLKYYVDLGARSFVVNNDETAKMIKKYNPRLEVIASITKKLSYTDFTNSDLSMYDKFILYFPFNRSLDTLKKLPTKYKYILLVNCSCGYTCPGTFHWFAKPDANGIEIMNGPVCQSGVPSQSIRLLSTDLNLFDDYVDGYKLQGREYPTAALKNDIEEYIKRELIDERAKQYYEIFLKNEKPEVYYNTATLHSDFLK